MKYFIFQSDDALSGSPDPPTSRLIQAKLPNLLHETSWDALPSARNGEARVWL
jgi:hypothetical protein